MAARAAASVLAAALAACGAAPASQDQDAELNGARADLYQCEGCDGVYERDASHLSSHGRIGPADEPGEPLTLQGTVYKSDGQTPAPDIVIYAYQTNSDGLYANGSNETEWSRRHGNLRGWVKTGHDGTYRFETIKPAPYPDQDMPAHVHFTILEPGRQPYWIDDIVFDGEFGVTDDYRRQMTNRGGNGISSLGTGADGQLTVRRDIILERHPGKVTDL